MKYNSVSSGPSSEVIWKCWFTRTEQNISEQGGWATSVLSSNLTLLRPLAKRENQLFKLKPPFWSMLICQDCVICQFSNLVRTSFPDLYFTCLFYRQFCRPSYCMFLRELWLANFPGRGPIWFAESSNWIAKLALNFSPKCCYGIFVSNPVKIV